jgi:hypothetical protein
MPCSFADVADVQVHFSQKPGKNILQGLGLILVARRRPFFPPVFFVLKDSFTAMPGFHEVPGSQYRKLFLIEMRPRIRLRGKRVLKKSPCRESACRWHACVSLEPPHASELIPAILEDLNSECTANPWNTLVSAYAGKNVLRQTRPRPALYFYLAPVAAAFATVAAVFSTIAAPFLSPVAELDSGGRPEDVLKRRAFRIDRQTRTRNSALSFVYVRAPTVPGRWVASRRCHPIAAGWFAA